MTRLITEWISDIETEIQIYDDKLKSQLRMNLCQLTAKACGITEEKFLEKMNHHAVAVIPITAELGVISGFSESVSAILKVMGAHVFVTKGANVDGIYEGLTKGADILFMADDDRYIGFNIKTGAVADNNIATAMGYVTALEQLAGDLRNKKVLVIGCGIVGRKAVSVLKEKDVDVYIYDKNKEKVKSLNCGYVSVLSEDTAIKTFKFILDATNEGGWIYKDMLADNVIIATPGIPMSLDKKAYELHKDKVVHDYLQIGTAVMLGLTL